MKEKIIKFLEEKEPILWIKPENFEEILNIVKNSLDTIEDKKVFIYEDKKLLDLIENKEVEGIDSLFLSLDEVYPQGIRKSPVYLIVKNSMGELTKKDNLDYIEEIIQNKLKNPTYNFTLIILENQEVPDKLEENTYVINEQVVKNETYIREYVEYKLKEKRKTLDKADLQDFLEFLRAVIISVLNKRESSLDKDMVFVQGRGYTHSPLYSIEPIEMDNIEVYKYPVTQELWIEIMGYNPSYYKNGGLEKPVENIKWMEAIEFCNKLSEKNGLTPVYLIEKEKVAKIRYLNGELVDPDKADFSKTEGYRLPLNIEWEWFTVGGALSTYEEAKFDDVYFSTFEIRRSSALYRLEQTYDVGTYKPNLLGLYDCLGNVSEWTYDTDREDWKGIEISNKRKYIYDYKRWDWRIHRGLYEQRTRKPYFRDFYEEYKNFCKLYFSELITGVDSYTCVGADVEAAEIFNEDLYKIYTKNGGYKGFRFVRTVL